MNKTYLPGVDAGGTHTVCLLADGDKKILGRGEAGPANMMAVGLAATVPDLSGRSRGPGVAVPDPSGRSRRRSPAWGWPEERARRTGRGWRKPWPSLR